MSRRARRAVRVSLGAVFCLALSASAALPHPAYLDDRIPGTSDPRTILWEPKQAAHERLEEALALPPDAARASQSDYDVHYYDLDIAIDEILETVGGTVAMEATSTVDDLTTVVLNLYDNMTVDWVTHGGAPASYTHAGNLITVILNETLQTGDPFEIRIAYGGAPVDDAIDFGSHYGTPIVSSLSEPSGARQWWPCKDIPDDKADSARIALTVDDAYVAVSNGMLSSEVDNGATKTYTWFEQYPITTYLISIAVTNYSHWTDNYTHSGGTMPIENYVYPEHLSAAQEDLSITADAIAILTEVFGEYPFINERYGHAIFTWGGAMEHQTCTSYGRVLIRGDHYYDWVLVHELAHQWWGDWVTCGTWYDIWLNEGFASYSEALYFEHLYGEGTYDSYVASYDSYGYFEGPIYDPDNTFNRTVYDKGALVLHMLRRVLALGDAGPVDHYPIDALQTVLGNYSSAHAYGTAVTPDFQGACEDYYGDSLDWFFLPWVYGENRPSYEYSWVAGDQGPPYGVMLHVDQVQSNAGLFTMPIDIGVQTVAGDTMFVAWNDQWSQDFFFEVDSQPTGLSFDPNNWILKYVSQVSTGIDDDEVPAELSLSSSADAGRSGTRVRFAIPKPGHTRLDVFDVTGRLVTTLVDRNLPAGTHEVVWSGISAAGSNAASGVYFARLLTASGTASGKLLLVR